MEAAAIRGCNVAAVVRRCKMAGAVRRCKMAAVIRRCKMAGAFCRREMAVFRLLHDRVKASPVGAVQRGDIAHGGQGIEDAGGIGSTHQPLGILSQNLPVDIRKHLTQEVSSGSRKDCIDMALDKQAHQLRCPFFGCSPTQAVHPDMLGFPDPPALLPEDIQAFFKALDLVSDTGTGCADADGCVVFQKFWIDHNYASFIRVVQPCAFLREPAGIGSPER